MKAESGLHILYNMGGTLKKGKIWPRHCLLQHV